MVLGSFPTTIDWHDSTKPHAPQQTTDRKASPTNAIKIERKLPHGKLGKLGRTLLLSSAAEFLIEVFDDRRSAALVLFDNDPFHLLGRWRCHVNVAGASETLKVIVWRVFSPTSCVRAG
jgi:hypothetical protein